VVGPRGSGKSWILRTVCGDLIKTGKGVAYLSVRPRSTVKEAIVQLAECMNFRFQRPTSWIVRFVAWFFEQHSDASSEEETRELSDWHRLAQAIEDAAEDVSSGAHWVGALSFLNFFSGHICKGEVPSLVIDNLQNVNATEDGDEEEEDEDGIKKMGECEKFILALIDWAAWCADRRVLRVVLCLPTSAAVERVLGSSARMPALHVFEVPVLKWVEAEKHLEPLREDVDDDEAKAVLWNVESPLDARLLWDSRMQVGEPWDKIAKQLRSEGKRILRNYDLELDVNQIDTGDTERNVRRARAWRWLLQLADEHNSGLRRGVLPHNKRYLGAAATKVVNEMTEASILSVQLMGGETRVHSAPLRFHLAEYSKREGSDDKTWETKRNKLERYLERLDPEWKNDWQYKTNEVSSAVHRGPVRRDSKELGSVCVRRLSHNRWDKTIAAQHDMVDEQASMTLASHIGALTSEVELDYEMGSMGSMKSNRSELQ